MSLESSLDPHVEDIVHEQFDSKPRMTGQLTRFNATIARYGMYFAVTGLLILSVSSSTRIRPLRPQ